MEGMTFVVITAFVTEFFKDSLRLSVDLLPKYENEDPGGQENEV